MKIKVVYPDGTWFIGERGWKFMSETSGTHHFKVTNHGDCPLSIQNQKVAVPIRAVKYFILDYKGE